MNCLNGGLQWQRELLRTHSWEHKAIPGTLRKIWPPRSSVLPLPCCFSPVFMIARLPSWKAEEAASHLALGSWLLALSRLGCFIVNPEESCSRKKRSRESKKWVNG